MIPISAVRFGPEEESLVLEVLRSGQLAQGTYVERFEQEFASIHGVKHAIAVNNGTTALIAALQALGIGPGDEVITSPFSFVATLNSILAVGATARFADIGPDYNIDPNEVARLINNRTAAIMPVHLYGYMADMDALVELAQAADLHIVEDAAQSVGATYHGRAAGSFGIGCFSLYATKNLNTGEGGVITSNDDEVADRLRLLRNQGMRKRYQYEIAGYNYRLTNLAAAVGLPQLARLSELTERRQRNARALREGLSEIEGLLLPPEAEAGRTHVYHQFTVRIATSHTRSRDDIAEALASHGVGSGVYYPRVIYDYDCYGMNSGVVKDPVPFATIVASEVLSLPVHPFLTESDIETVISATREAVDG